MPDDLSRLSEAVARDPGGTAWVALADALRRANRPADAERTALRGLVRHPYCADGHDVLARIRAASGDRVGAGDEWEMALRLDPNQLSALLGSAWLAFRDGLSTRARQHLLVALRVAPNDVRVSRALAARLRRAGDEASKAVEQLHMEEWENLVVDFDNALLALSPSCHQGVMGVVTPPDMPPALTRRILARANQHAERWLEAT